MMNFYQTKDLVENSSAEFRLNEKLLRDLLTLGLTFNNLDSLELYKCERISASDQKCFLSKLWTNGCIPLSAYLSIKPLAVLLMRHVRSNLGSRGETNYIDINEHLGWILALTGDPFSSLQFADWTISVYYPCFAFWIKCYLPAHFKYSEPLDMSFARFTLQPEQEIRRFDLKAAELLNQLMETLKYELSKMSHNLRFNLKAHKNQELIQIQMLRTQKQLDGMQKVAHQISSIRPESLSLDWYQRSNRIIPFILIAWVPMNTLVSFLVTGFYTVINWRRRCDLGGYSAGKQGASWMSGCSLTDVFSLPELLLMTEINFMIDVMAITSVTVQMALHLLQIRHQLCMAKSVTEKLRKLVGELHDFDLDRETKVKGKTLNERLTFQLCANMIGVRMFQREMRNCVAALAHGARFAIATCLMFTAAAFASLRQQKALVKINQSHMGAIVDAAFATENINLSIGILLCTWLLIWGSANIILLTCAIIPSEITGLNRLIYSLVAQLIRLQSKHRSSRELQLLTARDHRVSVDDPITSLWRRLSSIGNYLSERLAVCVFTNRLTYERVLAINFYVLTIISLLTMYI